ncbi:M56 family metallopeptidase [uncultured Kriegella sp.]|uniref:M56 family metallopeptidase n=1 Tax=uncultured Kriegella sp. TaxID=1798910 RepID=UPI0030DC6AEA|tara:strand:+ start:6021 stop:8681 length:2661 start_codon:yes stop_codon:yes gene_type:complete
MILHLLKSSLCLAAFLLFYQIFLEKEHMHHFKRYFLLGSVLLALGIPFITFTEYVTAPLEVFQPMSFEVASPVTVNQDISFQYWPFILWSIYGLGVIVFAFKFIKNLWSIGENIRINPKIKINEFIHVLLQKAVIPHTFFRYIFLNKQQFETDRIPEEVMVHEETHAKQLHSIDVLVIELLQVLLWFNPLVYWAKYHIKLNHEFLADQAVLASSTNTNNYQKLLLSFTEHHHQSLANAIIYSSNSSIRLSLFGKSFTFGRNPVGQVKKRFKVMKTHTSKKSVLFRSFLLLPLLALLVYGFSDTKIKTKKSDVNTSILSQQKRANGATEAMMKEYITFIENYQRAEVKMIRGDSYERIVAIYDLMTEEQKASVTNYNIIKLAPINLTDTKPQAPSQHLLDQWKNKEYCAIWIDGKVTDNTFLNNKKPSDFSHYFSSFVHKNARSLRFPQDYQVHLYTKSAFDEAYLKANVNTYNQLLIQYNKARKDYIQSLGGNHSELRILEARLNLVYQKLSTSEIQKYKVQKWAKLPDPTVIEVKGSKGQLFDTYETNQKGATQDQLKKFNTLAKKYNAQPQDKRVVPLQDLKTLEHIYGRMTEIQKKEAQPFPECNAPLENLQGAIDFIKILINKNGQLLVGSELVTIEKLDSFLMKFNTHLSKEERQKSVRAIIVADKSAPKATIATVENLLNEYGVAQIDIRGPENSSPPPTQNGATKDQIKEFNTLAKKYNAQPQEKRVVPLHDLKTLEHIYGQMTQTQKKEAQPFPECPEPPKKPASPIAPNKSSQTLPPPPPPVAVPDGKESQAIPPPPPPYKTPNPEKHSKKLLNAFKEFDTKANTYSKAVNNYTQHKKGTITNLQKLYKETMVDYDNYVDLAVEAGLMSKPIEKSTN